MRLLQTLNVGQEFTPAHPNQVDVRGRPMSGFFTIEKIFAQEPFYRLCVGPGLVKHPLTMDTVVLLRHEPRPSEQEVESYYDQSTRVKVPDRGREHFPPKFRNNSILLGYDVTMPESAEMRVLSHDQQLFMKLVGLIGRSRILPDEAKAVLSTNIRHFKSKIRFDFQFYHLVTKLHHLGYFRKVRGPRPIQAYERFHFGDRGKKT